MSSTSSFDKVQEYFGSSFFEDVTELREYQGYYTEWGYNSAQQRLPFDVDVISHSQRVKPSAIMACVFVVLVLVTIFTSLRRLFSR